MLSILTWTFFFSILYFEVLLLIGFVERLRMSVPETKGLAYHPKVEIIVPCFNEQDTVAGTIHSLLNLEYPSRKLRIHVVDDGSTDGTHASLKEFKNNPQVTISYKENGGKHTALNLAIKNTRADIIGCLDADSFVNADALFESIKVFEATDAMAVTPAIKVDTPVSFFQHMQKAEYEVGMLFRRVFADANAQFITPGPFSLYKKEVFETIGIFKSAHNTEDLEMGLRMQEAGYLIENAPKSVVYTRAPKTFKPLFKQRVRWAYGFLRNVRPYKHLFFNTKNVYLGFLILPLTFISILAAAYMPFVMLKSTAFAAVTKVVEFQTIGFSAFYFNPLAIDWYTITPTAIMYVTLALFILTSILVLAGKYIGGEKVQPDKGLVLYILLYGIFGPLWLTKALFDAVFIKKNSWR
ncbi:glycosyltransferase family 2 protein [Candidatus Wolfebacteria bacterium]|nr:glycosyltransferase family 2 protein [Candidatus Wolfebacteria bacterium]